MEQDRKAYFNQAASRWDELHPAGPQAEAVLCGLDLLGSLEGLTVADVGCGTGILAGHVLPRLGQGGRLVAIDFAEEMVRRARERYPDPRATFLACDALGSGLEPGSVDVVLCYNSMAHFEDKARAVSAFVRWLGEGGRLLVWHDIGADAIASIHQRVGGPVGGDRLPPSWELAGVMEASGLKVQLAQESPESYLVLAERPSARG